jgi:inorganic pyrophosphatase
MNMDKISAGSNLPEEFNVIIEIPANSSPIKYEMDKDSGALFVDRFVGTGMSYPANYGFIPHTLSEDGDPADVVVITPFPIVHGAVVKCRALGVLRMEDESGIDAKILAVPTVKSCALYANVKSIEDIQPLLVEQIKYFFEHYKGLEKGKWVKITGWEGIEAAKKEIVDSVTRYNK